MVGKICRAKCQLSLFAGTHGGSDSCCYLIQTERWCVWVDHSHEHGVRTFCPTKVMALLGANGFRVLKQKEFHGWKMGRLCINYLGIMCTPETIHGGNGDRVGEV